jgi:hypothetical protein
MHQTLRLVGVLAIICVHASFSGAAPFQATAGPPKAGPPKAASDIRLSTLAGFTVDYPKKDWLVGVGAGSSLVVFVHKTREATVAIERTRVRPLAQNEITEQTARLELEDWLARRPLSSALGHQLLDIAGARFIMIDLLQPGPQGSERVRMYTLPRGADWFRVICTTTQGSFEKYLDTCHRIALTLTPTP